MTNIIIFGNRASTNELGNFSKAIYEQGNKTPGVSVFTKLDSIKPDIAIYSSRSDKQLKEALDICSKFNIPMIILSTDIQDTINDIITNVEIIYLPNSSIRTQKFIEDVVSFKNKSNNWEVRTFTEWHQESKNSLSGTAVHVAKQINYDPSEIIMIRNDFKAFTTQSIPNNTKAFAIHAIEFINKNTAETKIFSIKTIGRDEYVHGAIDFAVKHSQ